MQYIAGISISLFIVALLFSKKDKSLSNKYLLGWMLVNALHLALQYAFVSNALLQYPFLYGILAPMPLFQGVFLYFYVSSVTDQFPKKPYAVWAHFIPSALSYLYLIRYFFILPSENQLQILENKGAEHQVFITILLIAIMLSGVIYVAWSLLLLQRHKKNILNRFSELEKVDLKWLQFLIYGLGVLWGIVIFARKDEYIYTGVVVFVILTGFFGIQQIDIFKRREIEEQAKDINDDSNKKIKYAKSGLSNEVSEDLYSKLNKLIEKDFIYRQQELSIGQLAERLDTLPNYLSQVINEQTGQNFFDFINSCRIEDFKRQIADPKNSHFTILSLAFECGFNSKSSFNRYFKKATGLTPSQYSKSLSKQ